MYSEMDNAQYMGFLLTLKFRLSTKVHGHNNTRIFSFLVEHDCNLLCFYSLLKTIFSSII